MSLILRFLSSKRRMLMVPAALVIRRSRFFRRILPPSSQADALTNNILRQTRINCRCLTTATSVPDHGFYADTNSNTWVVKGAKTKAQSLLNKEEHPLGSFTQTQYDQAKRILDLFKGQKVSDLDSVKLSIGLLERLVTEVANEKDDDDDDGNKECWFTEPRYYTPLVALWRDAAKRGLRVIAPTVLMQKLTNMSKQYPAFRYNVFTISVIMDVAIKQAPHPTMAPAIAEELLQFTKNEAARTQDVDLRPNLFLYNQVLQAWAASGLPAASERISHLVEEMGEKDIVSYTILLRFWAERGLVNKVGATLDTMTKEGIEPDVLSLSQASQGFAKGFKMDEAERLLEQLIDKHERSNVRHVKAFEESVLHIMLAYRNIASSDRSSNDEKETALQKAESLLQRLDESTILDGNRRGKFIMQHMC